MVCILLSLGYFLTEPHKLPPESSAGLKPRTFLLHPGTQVKVIDINSRRNNGRITFKSKEHLPRKFSVKTLSILLHMALCKRWNKRRVSNVPEKDAFRYTLHFCSHLASRLGCERCLRRGECTVGCSAAENTLAALKEYL